MGLYDSEELFLKLNNTNTIQKQSTESTNLTQEQSLSVIFSMPEWIVKKLIEEYGLEQGDFHIENVNRELCTNIPTEFDMGKVYTRLIVDTLYPDDDYVEGILRIYNDEICRTLDDYNNGSYYEPSYVIARAYKNGEF